MAKSPKGSVDRRGFLRGAAVGAAALVTQPSVALPQPQKRPPARRRSHRRAPAHTPTRRRHPREPNRGIVDTRDPNSWST